MIGSLRHFSVPLVRQIALYLFALFSTLTLFSVCLAQPTPWRLAGSFRNSPGSFAFFGANNDTIYGQGTYWLIRSTNRGNTWDSVSGELTGVLTSLAVDPLDFRHLLCISGGNEMAPYLHKSTDGGLTWTEVFYAIAYATSIIEQKPLQPRTLYVGLGPRALRRTTDFGETWDSLPSPHPTAGLWSLSISNSNPNVIYAGLSRLISKSTDAGLTWTDITPPILFGLGSIVRVNPWNENIVYAAIYGTGETAAGMYKSTDGGTSWTEINNGLDSLSWQAWRLLINPQRPSELYLGILGVAHRLFRTTNSGESWHPFDWGLPSTGSISAVSGIAIDTLHDRLYVGAGAASPSDSGGVFVLDLATEVQIRTSPLPREIKLLQNYPNPFNPSTEIRFDLPTISDVSLMIYDVLGRKIAALASGSYIGGSHAVKWDASDRSGGVYFVRMIASDQQGIQSFSRVLKLVLMK